MAESVNSLNLAYCSDGAGGSGKSGSFSVGRVNYICEITLAVPLVLSQIPAELEGAKRAIHRVEYERRMANARDLLDKSKDMIDHAYDYINNRSATASVGAWISDTWWLLALVALL